MRRSTLNTGPLSYSKTLQPLRAGEASALTTGLGSVSLVSLDIYRLPSGSLVPQHVPESGPASVENGFRHSRFRKLRRTHIADDDQIVCIRQSPASDMKVMPAHIGDLCRNGAGAFLVSGTLRLTERAFVLPVVAQGRNFGAVAACRERFEAKVDSDFAVADRQGVRDLALKSHVPATSRILNEATGLEDAFDVTGLPEAKAPFEVDHAIAVNTDSTGDERYPSERALSSEAGAKAWACAVQIARCGKLATDGANSIAMQAKLCAASCAEIDQIEGGRPARRAASVAALFGLSLRSHAEIPDLITGNGMASEMLAGDGILDAEFECENTHGGSVLLRSGFDQERVVGLQAFGAFAIVSPHKLNLQERPRVLCHLDAPVPVVGEE